jgi:hypothetical protein
MHPAALQSSTAKDKRKKERRIARKNNKKERVHTFSISLIF